MDEIKKIIFLLLVTASFAVNSKAQSSPGNEKITVTNFNVDEKNNQLLINWSAAENAGVSYWQVQGSADGQSFATLALVLGPDPQQQGSFYQYKGKIRKEDKNKRYYRLCGVGTDGLEIISKIIIQPAK